MFEDNFSVSTLDSGTQNDFLRMRVLVHLDKPLIPGFYLALHDGSLLWVQFKYEGIVKVCVRCGQVGHKINGCCETEEKIKAAIDKLMSDVLSRGFPVLQADDNFLMFKLDLRVNSHISNSSKRQVRMGQDKMHRHPCGERSIYPGRKFEQGSQPFRGLVLQPKNQGGHECGETVLQSSSLTHSSSLMEKALEAEVAKEQTEVAQEQTQETFFVNATLFSGETDSMLEHLHNVENEIFSREETSESMTSSILEGVLNDQMSITDGFMGLADLYHKSDIGEIHKDSIVNDRKRKWCNKVTESLVPSENFISFEQVKSYPIHIKKRGCVGAGIHGRQVNAITRSYGFLLTVTEVDMVEVSDSSYATAYGTAGQNGFAEVGPSQPPLSP